MLKRLVLIAGVAAIAATGYVVIPTANAASTNASHMADSEKQPELIEVKVCPVTHGKVHGEGAGSEVVGKYKVYFCCNGCPKAFDKLTPEQKLQKAEEAYLIQKQKADKKAE